MRFLWNNPDLEYVLTELLEDCETIRWAVAWATKNAPCFNLLKRSWSKISQLTVGLHYYQTDPKFISAFYKHPNARFVLNQSGVFHPKLYYFEHGDGRWDCVVGSPNFTGAAFSENSEAAVRINQDDAAAKKAHKDISAALNEYRNRGDTFTREDVERYRKVWKNKRIASRELTKTDPSLNKFQKGSRSHDDPILNEGWKQYFREVKMGRSDLKEMLEILDRAKKLFYEHRRFSDMDENDRRRIAGTVARLKGDNLDWRCFGSMGRGKFPREIKENNPRISDALDNIPLKDPLVRKDFDEFVKRFRKKPHYNPLATATRLLAMKRPDYFVCLNSQNKETFCEEYGIQEEVTLGNYWPCVIERIQETEWWNSPEPSTEIERRVWRCRVAMLDAIYWSGGAGG